MLYQIFGFILQIIEGLVAGTCLLRLLFHFQNISLSPASGNSLGPFVFAVTNWLVLPIRRFIPAIGKLDTASLIGAYLIILIKTTLLWLLATGPLNLGYIFELSVFELIQMSLSCLNGLVLVYAVMSWINPDSPINFIFTRLVSPMLRPIQKVLPLLGGVDLSPLALLALIQIAILILQNLQSVLLGMYL